MDAFQGAEKDVVIVASTRTERLGFIVRYCRDDRTVTTYKAGNLCALSLGKNKCVCLGEKIFYYE